MAIKRVFITSNDKPFIEKDVDYLFYAGFAASQRTKCVESLHRSIQNRYKDKKILEVSTKSNNELGKKFSAFNLKLDGKPLECIFQSSKVFYGGKQFTDLLNCSPKEAKRYIRDNTSGLVLEKFSYKGIDFPLYPKTLFYDYIYIKALIELGEESKVLKDYDIFTDIEFDFNKSINCQARTCSIYSYLLRNNKVDEYIKDINSFKKLYF